MENRFTPGMFVRHPTRPDWGSGQVQSAVGHRVTVNFENAGKRLIDATAIKLEVIDIDEAERGSIPGG